jgi:hypothetical protein
MTAPNRGGRERDDNWPLSSALPTEHTIRTPGGAVVQVTRGDSLEADQTLHGSIDRSLPLTVADLARVRAILDVDPLVDDLTVAPDVAVTLRKHLDAHPEAARLLDGVGVYVDPEVPRGHFRRGNPRGMR